VPLREIRRVQGLLNGRPRKVLDYEKPLKAFTRLVALNS
jgi:IS30 family transposase